jgi:hypothetical protein
VAENRLGSPVGTRGTMMQNKPNCPKRGTEAVSRSRPADRIPSIPLFYHSTIPVQCRWCKTKPISRCAQWGGAWRRRPWRAIVPNKAKLGQDGRSGGRHIRDACCAEQTQFGPAPAAIGGEMCQTNPILVRPSGTSRAARGLEAVAPNKANSRRGGLRRALLGRRAPVRAKQTQFGPAPRQVGTFRVKRTQSGPAWRTCETNPIRPGSGRHRGRNVPNKPNPAPGASVVGVKQSQFREGWIDAQVPCRKGIMTVLTHRWPQENKANSQAGSQSRVCQTKPIPGAGLSPASGRLLLGRDEYNGWESFFRFSRAHFGRVGTPIYER